MAIRWIAVVSRSSAEFLRAQSGTVVASMTNELGRARSRIMTTDKPGSARNRTASRSSTHSLDGDKNPHNEAAKAFARRIAKFVDQQRKLKRFDQILIAAEPKMAGWLASALPAKVKEQVEWVHKDLAKLTPMQIKSFVKSRSANWPLTYSS